MEIFDITLTLSKTVPVWPGSKQPEFDQVLNIKNGDPVNVTNMSMSVHTGTHVDAPCHFVKEGASVEELPLDILTGEAVVIELLDHSTLTKKILQNAQIPPKTSRLLIKTRNSDHWKREPTEFDQTFVALSLEGAKFLVERGIQLIGVDYLSVATFNELASVHKLLFEASVVVVEGLDLSKIAPGKYNFCCLPLKIAGADGAPARAILSK
ncbi:MAG: cyclase family protein [Candidatus Algichlamydia australiensis]|nr:cyclase family protein [Chlamydiales bacterium]